MPGRSLNPAPQSLIPQGEFERLPNMQHPCVQYRTAPLVESEIKRAAGGSYRGLAEKSVVQDYAEEATMDRQPAAFVVIVNDLRLPVHTCADVR